MLPELISLSYTPCIAVYLPPLLDEGDERVMQFRLTFEGEVPSAKSSKIADRKMKIRKAFHSQLRYLWDITPALKDRKVLRKRDDGVPEEVSLAERMADMHCENGYRFVPLVHSMDELQLRCELDILLLCNEGPDGVLKAGDLDNRVKTLVDALKRPQNGDELGSFKVPGGDENPFFVLLEDDRLVTGLKVESDRLLLRPEVGPEDNHSGGHGYNKLWAKAIIKAKVYPSRIHQDNLDFL